MSSPSTTLQQLLDDAIRGQFQVTRLDTERLNSKLNWVIIALGFIITLILSTYAAIAWFTWRLVSLLIDK